MNLNLSILELRLKTKNGCNIIIDSTIYDIGFMSTYTTYSGSATTSISKSTTYHISVNGKFNRSNIKIFVHCLIQNDFKSISS